MLYVAYINDDGLEIQDDEDDDSVDRIFYCSYQCFTGAERTSTGITSKAQYEPDYCEHCGHCEKVVIHGIEECECEVTEGDFRMMTEDEQNEYLKESN